MANTFSQIYIQIVFAYRGRENLISQNHKEELHKYITGIITNRKQKLLAINCMPDHTHVFVGIKPSKQDAPMVFITMCLYIYYKQVVPNGTFVV